MACEIPVGTSRFGYLSDCSLILLYEHVFLLLFFCGIPPHDRLNFCGLTVMAGWWDETAARQSAGLHLPSQWAPLWGDAGVRPGGFRLSDVPPWSSSVSGGSEGGGGVEPLRPQQVSARAAAGLLVPEPCVKRSHPHPWSKGGAPQPYNRQVDINRRV